MLNLLLSFLIYFKISLYTLTWTRAMCLQRRICRRWRGPRMQQRRPRLGPWLCCCWRRYGLTSVLSSSGGFCSTLMASHASSSFSPSTPSSPYWTSGWFALRGLVPAAGPQCGMWLALLGFRCCETFQAPVFSNVRPSYMHVDVRSYVFYIIYY